MPRRHPKPDPKPRPSLGAAQRRKRRLQRRRRKSPPRPEPGILLPEEILSLQTDLRALRRNPNPDQQTKRQMRNLQEELDEDRRLRKNSRA